VLGRFRCQDPVSGLVRYWPYLYAADNPSGLVDPAELFWGELWGGPVGGAESMGRSIVSVGQSWGHVVGLNHMSWDQIHSNTPLGQAEGTWAETPTKVATGVAVGAVAVAGGIIAVQAAAAGVSAVASAPAASAEAAVAVAATGEAGYLAEQELAESGAAEDLACAVEAPLEGTALARQVGQLGEDAVGINGPKIGIHIGDQLRFPDRFDNLANVLDEVKNVKSLSYTQQLRDYVTFAQQNGSTFNLRVRPSTYISGPLNRAILDILIRIKYIPGAK
jgi:hypothetical protein